MRHISKWNLFESIEMEKPTYRGVANTEKNLIDKFGISFSDIKDIFQDILDDDFKIKISINNHDGSESC
jgi:hypothetical protein